MNTVRGRALLWGVLVAGYLRFGLEPTGWTFYELSHWLHVDWLYWGYSVFRGGGYAFSLWPYQSAACILAGAAVTLLLWRRAIRAKKS